MVQHGTRRMVRKHGANFKRSYWPKQAAVQVDVGLLTRHMTPKQCVHTAILRRKTNHEKNGPM